jgi:hypothetical protein
MQAPIVDRSVQTDNAKRKPTRRTGEASDFAQHLATDGSSQAEQPVRAPAPEGLAALLGIQEVEPEAELEPRHQRAARYGANLLARLDQLRMQLLDGCIPASRLAALAQALGSDRRRSGDQQLDGIIDEIELRVQVEMAKIATAHPSPMSGDTRPVADPF